MHSSDGLAIATLNGTILAILFAGLVGYLIVVVQMLNEKTHAMLDEADRINHLQVKGGWGWSARHFDRTSGSWERWLEAVRKIIAGAESDDSLVPPVADTKARGQLLAELLYELTTHYPARASDLGTDPTTEIPMHTPESV